MNFEEINTFLSVVQHRNIAHAANELFISQGTASARIQHIEQELGISLLFRQKGIKNVTLTPEGEHFLSIAQQMLSLMQQAEQLKNLTIYRELRIASTETVNLFHFADLYKHFVEQHPNIKLYLQTEHSIEIHQLIENQQTDLGFVFTLHKSPNVIAAPLYKEKNVILYHKDSLFHQTRNIQDLKPEDEIYMTYGNDFDLWHKQLFANSMVKKISLGAFSMLPHFITVPCSWTILPHSLADLTTKNITGLACAEIPGNPPPLRTAYILQHRYSKPWIQETANLFLRDVFQQIRSTPSMQFLYPYDFEYDVDPFL